MQKLEKYIIRNESVIDRESNLEHLYTFKDFPIFMGCTNKPIDDDIVGDMIWEIDSFGLVQLSKLVPLDKLYMDQHMDATGVTWDTYNLALADFICNNKLGDILEIGGGSGKLANLILKKDDSLFYTVVEPNPIFEETNRIKLNKSFFTKNTQLPTNTNTIVLSQVFEHVYDPEEFLKEIYEVLPLNGLFVFGYPNLEYLFSNHFTNAINFEHTMLMTDYYVDFFLAKTGFKIITKIAHGNHSHFYSVEKVAKNEIKIPILENKYTFYKQMFQDFINYHVKLVDELNNTIDKSSSEVYLFGAHIFSQYLFAFGLKTNRIKCILDNSPIKQGKRLYGSNLMVNSPQVLEKSEEPLVILKAGLYNQEIKEDILQKINSTAIFI